jgi:primosomal protein N' (replication factor Y) (superfamily II helicase)
MSCYLEIAIDTPLRRVFDYGCPDDARVAPGMRVRVPFGRRQTIGIVMKVKANSDVPPAKLKSITAILDDEPLFDSVLFNLLTWSSDYYRHPIGEVLAAALPVSLRSGAPLIDTIEQWRLTPLGKSEWTSLPTRNKRLRALASAIAQEASNETLAEISSWRAALKDLQSRGWVECTQVAVDQPSAQRQRAQPSLSLNDAQRIAVEKIRAACAQDLPNRFRTLLLHGVTGSGKTEVYLQAIETVIAAGKQALVLVPEIALTPQLVARFQERFNVPMAVLHSAVNESERLATWRAARNGTAPIVIGTRSAIFAPLKTPGILIVDEEHDSSYKQQEGFRYSARDLAIVRAQRHSIPVVLGSATPSLESLARVKKQPDDLLALPTRAGNAQPARVRVVDLRKHAHTDGIAGPTMLTIKQHLDDGGQVLLYLNRRGFAPVLFCPACGWSAACRRCDARMTVHQKENKLTCHHCGLDSAIPELCASCNAPAKPIGQGTERIEGTVARLFPGVTVARIDRDNIRRKGELEATLETIHSGAVRILVGTQMLTKGHHFPNVTLVVVLNADQGLFGTDFRAAERLAQNIVQVAGRAGRAERIGEVLIQTEYPEHPLLMSLLEGGYSAFADSALRERESAHLPPYARLALLRADANTLSASMNFLHEACEHAKSLRPTALRILGPVAAPMARKAGRYRGQLLFVAPTHTPLQKLLARLLPLLEASPQTKRVRWSIDVDPVELF